MHIVDSMEHVKINVADPDAVIRDATDILGLTVTHRDAGQTWLSSNGRLAELVLINAGENSAHAIGLKTLSVDDVRAAGSAGGRCRCHTGHRRAGG